MFVVSESDHFVKAAINIRKGQDTTWGVQRSERHRDLQRTTETRPGRRVLSLCFKTQLSDGCALLDSSDPGQLRERK